VEFNPAKVGAYRLIGYENRVLAAQDFNDDKKDAGDIGSGHTVTVLFEVIPPDKDVELAHVPAVDDLEFQKPAGELVPSDDLVRVKVRYKEPDGSESKLLRFSARDDRAGLDKASADFRFAAAVAEFGMVLRNSPYKGGATVSGALDLSRAGADADREGYRADFVTLVEKTRRLAPADGDSAPAASKEAPSK